MPSERRAKSRNSGAPVFVKGVGSKKSSQKWKLSVMWARESKDSERKKESSILRSGEFFFRKTTMFLAHSGRRKWGKERKIGKNCSWD